MSATAFVKPHVTNHASAERALSSAPARPHEAAEPGWLTRGRIPCLDGLRALSILIVLLEHSVLTHGFPGQSALKPVFGRIGAMGVDVFFAISGFLITLLLVREWDRTKKIDLKGFYVRRTLRLAPAAFAFLLVVFGLTCISATHLTGNNWMHVLTYTVNFDNHPAWQTGHLWSLSIEEQFYFVWPVAFLLLGPQRAIWVALAGLLAAPALRMTLLFLYPHHLGNFETWTPVRIDSIAMGCLLGLLALNPEFRRKARVSATWAVPIILVAIVCIPISRFIGTQITVYSMLLGPSVRATLIAVIIWLSINHASSWFGRLMEWKPLVGLGMISYSLYLWQQLFMVPDSTSWISRWPTNLVFALLTAIGSYYLIEQPFLRLKDRFSHRPKLAAQPPEAASA